MSVFKETTQLIANISKINCTGIKNIAKERENICQRNRHQPKRNYITRYFFTWIDCSKFKTFLLAWLHIIPASIFGSIISMADMASNNPKLQTIFTIATNKTTNAQLQLVTIFIHRSTFFSPQLQ